MAEGRRIGLLGWILIGFVVGVPFGIFFKDASISMSWMGDLFLRLLKMLIVPLVFFSLVTGTASISDPVKLGRVGVKIMVLYLATTAIAVTIGLIVAAILNPAAGMKLAPVAGFKAPTVPALKEVLLNLVPTNPFDSLAKGDILPVIAFAMFFGVAAALAGDKGKAIVGAIEAAAEAMYKLTTIIMWYAPLGVFSLIATTVAKQGPQVLLPFINLILTCYLAYFLHVALIYTSIVKFLAKVNPFKFFKGAFEIMMMAFVTRSSNATLPVTMRVSEEKLGLPRNLISFTLPLGATVNMDGTAIYQGIAALFIAAIYNVPLGFTQYLMIILLATLASIGTAGVPGAGLIMLAMVLQGVGLPLEGVGLIAGIDVILDMGRTCLNVTGDVACTTAVAYSEGEFSPQTINNL
ncbi:MAG: dicarboxylate/amino acid:cation symporter [candidate division NC10 bacterium]|nr:dicarboxylate/amino acid:cation symporter [candidate division NC10 bacterium]